MYFKVEPGNKTYDRLKEVVEKCISYNEQASALVKELGFKRYGKSDRHRAGGISCIEADPKPEGYISVGKKWQNLVYPKASNKAVLEKIAALPVMSFEEFGKPIGFKPHTKGLTYYRSYGVEKVGEIYLIEVDDQCDYTPVKGMEEILASEYKSLLSTKIATKAAVTDH